MIKLTYTKEMDFQDFLWNTEGEDKERMKELYVGIMEEAKEKGFKGSYDIYDGEYPEAIIEVYRDEKEREDAYLGKVEVPMFGYCKPLIEYLEKILNE